VLGIVSWIDEGHTRQQQRHRREIEHE
jgi:hypothetical protein